MMKTLKRIYLGLVVLGVGAILGAWGIQAVESRQRNLIVTATVARTLSQNVLLLKMLDEGKVDFAKSVLETNIQSLLQSTPVTLNQTTDVEMLELLEQSQAMARLAIADRTKSYTQLQKEIAK